MGFLPVPGRRSERGAEAQAPEAEPMGSGRAGPDGREVGGFGVLGRGASSTGSGEHHVLGPQFIFFFCSSPDILLDRHWFDSMCLSAVFWVLTTKI